MQDTNTNKNPITTTARLFSPGGTSSSQACAACRYQRRKCQPNCPLAKHFPPTHQKQFLNAHKLFGVSNILRVLRRFDPPEQDIAANTMIFEATVRANDPVGGCHRIISHLQSQINHSKAELDLVLQQLAILRARSQKMQNPNLQLTEETVYGHGVIDVDPQGFHNNHNSIPGGSVIKVDPEASFHHHNVMQHGSVIKVDPETSLLNSMHSDSAASSSCLHDYHQDECRDIKQKNPSEQQATKMCEKNVVG